MSKRKIIGLLSILPILFVTIFFVCYENQPIRKARTGWFYYSDGSCSEKYEKTSSKDVIGIIFSDNELSDTDTNNDTKYIIKIENLKDREPTWYEGEIYREKMRIGNELKTWFIPSNWLMNKIFIERGWLNISLQTLIANYVEDVDRLQGAFWTSDKDYDDNSKGLAVDFDEKSLLTSKKHGYKDIELQLRPVMRVYEPKLEKLTWLYLADFTWLFIILSILVGTVFALLGKRLLKMQSSKKFLLLFGLVGSGIGFLFAFIFDIEDSFWSCSVMTILGSSLIVCLVHFLLDDKIGNIVKFSKADTRKELLNLTKSKIDKISNTSKRKIAKIKKAYQVLTEKDESDETVETNETLETENAKQNNETVEIVKTDNIDETSKTDELDKKD